MTWEAEEAQGFSELSVGHFKGVTATGTSTSARDIYEQQVPDLQSLPALEQFSRCAVISSITRLGGHFSST